MVTKFEKPCAACGAPLGGGQFCEKCGADQKALSFDQDVARMLQSGPLRSARSSLLWVGILMAVGALLGFAQSGGEATAVLVVGLGTAALYMGMWQWSKRHTLAATAAGLGIFVTLVAGSAVVEPATLWQGLIVKIVVVVLLIRGLRAGVVLRSHGISGL
jgi:hypothetical protein